MLNCYCQLSSSVIFRQYGVSQSECKIDRPRPGLPRVSPRPHTEALGTGLVPAFKLLHHFVIIIPLRTNWVSEIRSPFLYSFRHFAIFHCKQIGCLKFGVPLCTHSAILL